MHDPQSVIVIVLFLSVYFVELTPQIIRKLNMPEERSALCG